MPNIATGTNAAVERSILGAILLNNAAFAEAAESKLRAADFSLDSHRKIYARMSDLAESSRPIDMLTLIEELERHNELQTVGDVAYVSSLVEGLPERPSIAHYITIVREASARRLAALRIEAAGRAVEDPSVPMSRVAEMGSTLADLSSGTALPVEFSEDALALRFSRKYEDELRYVNSWAKWLHWDSTRWAADTTLRIFDLARVVCREVGAECDGSQKGIATRLASKSTVASVERLAAADRRHASTPEQWDADPWLLNTPKGTVDLKTGELREHRRADCLTKITAASPEGWCDRWIQFLTRVTRGDYYLQTFLQRLIGYSLTGLTREHGLFFFYGGGANGKSVFLNTISELLADYARVAPMSLLTCDTTEQHPTALAGLRGSRFVTAIETEDGARWAETKIKAITGGDRVTARFMRGDYFDFTPEFKLLVAGNHRPGLRSVDEAIRRRIFLIPFTVTIPEKERDPQLSEKLRAEFPGILRWAIQGCLDWQREGLNPPGAVRDATANYLAAEDAMGRWLDERCKKNRDAWTASAELFADWARWCQLNDEAAGKPKQFAERLEARGFHFKRTNVARGFLGLSLTGMTRVLASDGDASSAPVTDVTRGPILPV